MQLSNFKIFIYKVKAEGKRLQRHDIAGRKLTRRKYTDSEILSIVMAGIGVCVLHRGFSDNFAGFIISFLGIFIGLFTSIAISMYDKSNKLIESYPQAEQKEKTRLIKVKNYLVQFTGLTAYSIYLAIILIMLLCLVLLHDGFKVDITKYKIVKSFDEVSLKSLWCFMTFIILLLHRFFTIRLLLNFLIITLFSITSYFSFLSSEYKKNKLTDGESQ